MYFGGMNLGLILYLSRIMMILRNWQRLQESINHKWKYTNKLITITHKVISAKNNNHTKSNTMLINSNKILSIQTILHTNSKIIFKFITTSHLSRIKQTQQYPMIVKINIPDILLSRSTIKIIIFKIKIHPLLSLITHQCTKHTHKSITQYHYYLIVLKN